MPMLMQISNIINRMPIGGLTVSKVAAVLPTFMCTINTNRKKTVYSVSKVI